jgi:hypothetical protein
MTEELAAGLKRTKEAVAASQAFYRLHKSSVSTPNAGGKCVTDGETSPANLAMERAFNRTFKQVVRNQTLEEVAREFDNMKAFGDTAASFATFVRGMKK